MPDRPKVLAEVMGRPFLAYVLDQLDGGGIRRVVLCTGYLGSQVRDAFGDRHLGMQVLYSQEATPLDTAGALRLALPMVGSHWILAMNGDSFCDVDLEDFWAWHVARGASASMVLATVQDTSAFGTVSLNPDCSLSSFQEKSSQKGAGWINGGVYLLGRNLFQDVPAGYPVSLERDLLPTWAGNGLFGYCSQGKFLDIGTAEGYFRAGEFFASSKVT